MCVGPGPQSTCFRTASQRPWPPEQATPRFILPPTLEPERPWAPRLFFPGPQASWMAPLSRNLQETDASRPDQGFSALPKGSPWFPWWPQSSTNSCLPGWRHSAVRRQPVFQLSPSTDHGLHSSNHALGSVPPHPHLTPAPLCGIQDPSVTSDRNSSPNHIGGG